MFISINLNDHFLECGFTALKNMMDQEILMKAVTRTCPCVPNSCSFTSYKTTLKNVKNSKDYWSDSSFISNGPLTAHSCCEINGEPEGASEIKPLPRGITCEPKGDRKEHSKGKESYSWSNRWQKIPGMKRIWKVRDSSWHNIKS